MFDNDYNPNEPLKERQVNIDAKVLPDGTLVFPVPSHLPVGSRLVLAHASGDDANHLLNVALSLPREEIEAYATFMARHGAIDREPTGTEINAIMQLIGNQLVDAQIEILGNVSAFLINRLGSGNMEEARKACTDSLAEQITAEAVKGGALSPTDSAETTEAIAKALQEWAERVMDKDNQQGEDNGSK
jgi:hypothetical protein